ncbi:hypothetical protein H5410_038538 [Solanum commersonii]|uniref:Cytochrome P450 n=1 Tax=Solanum commersonii TaxID=4109 RepID=A0A9J5YAZ0_SOLCO|nr:hypothetical protein H5410_038538 [Solanum commersonii]
MEISYNRIIEVAWFKPKKLEKYLRKSGLKGNSYKLFYGDLNELTNKLNEARSNPINFSDDIAQRLIPFFLDSINKNGMFLLFLFLYIYNNGLLSGKSYFVWQGPYPAVLITEPEHVKEIFTKNYGYQKIAHPNLFAKSFTKGLTFLEEDKWAKHNLV